MQKPKPKDSMWTDDQWRAVVESGQNILVSAGAGSGKTAVLTERIIEHIKDGVDVSKLVVLTFTNAAAREMRERVHQALSAVVSKYPHLNEQLTLLDAAQITTFDAYSQFLLKKYHYLLNLDSNLQIINSIYKTEFIQQVVDELFLEKYQSCDAEFLKLIDQYTIMDDNKIKQEVIYLMDKLENKITDYNVNDYVNPNKMQEATQTYVEIIMEQVEELKFLLGELHKIIDGDKFIEHIAKIREYFTPITTVKTYFDLFKEIKELPSRKPMVPRQEHDNKEEYKVQIKKINQVFDEIKRLASYPDESAMITELKAVKEYQETMVNLAKEANQKLIELKIANNMFDFIDISKLVIRIFEEHPEVRAEIRDNIFEIMIDEYQDTNDIQEYFINLIAKQNVYMVGDIKQAIYGFRNANPQNFQDKYLNYSQNKGGMVIDLNKNFRSRQEVLANINEVFTPLMSKTIGGIDYVGQQKLVYGNLMYENKNKDQNHNMDIISYEIDVKFNKAEQEARLIAVDIIDKINSGYQVNDKGNLRKASFKDFAILTSKKKNFDLYKRIFEEYQIPLEVQTTVNDDTKAEIYLINAIFRLLYTIEKRDVDVNREHFKFAFYSLLRNYPFDFNDAQIAKQIALANNIYDVINNPVNSEFGELAAALITSYKYYQTNTLAETLVYVLEQFRVVASLPKLTDVYASEMRIMEMINLYTNFSDQGLTLEDVINFEKLQLDFKVNLEMSDPIIVNDDVVKMMTIHKSKGLEFNVVYFPDFDAKFNMDDTTQKYRMTADYGYLMPVYETEEKITIYHEISKYNGTADTISEQIRLFYVALTRAKDKMIMLLSDDTLSANLPIDAIAETDKRKFRKFKDFILHQSGNLYKYNQLYLNEQIKYQADLISMAKDEEEPLSEAIEYRQIKVDQGSQIKGRASMQKYSLIDVKTRKMMDLGTTYHNVLETIDFTKEIAPQIINLDPKYQKIVKNVANLEVVQNAKRAFNEYQFQVKTAAKITTGIIDLLIEKEAEMIIIDYKLEDISKPEYEVQINTYADFVKTKTTKPIRGFLYSLINNELKEITIISSEDDKCLS